jgi:dTDP-4-amino-4,6-dideoxygalactose transaminase
MKESGIETRPGFYSPTEMRHLYKARRLPVSEDLARQVISLPSIPTLKEEEVDRICRTLGGLRR